MHNFNFMEMGGGDSIADSLKIERCKTLFLKSDNY